MKSTGDRARVVAVIPAFNEAPRIGAVLEAVEASPLVDEAVVVDDGSTDDTAGAAARYGVRVVRRGENGGKGAAMQTAREVVDADLIVFLDADLVGLTADHIESLLRPLVDDPDTSMTLGRFEGGRKRTDLAQRIVPSISGQRAVTRAFMDSLPDLAASRFGVEALITRHAKKSGAGVVEVGLTGITQVMKEEKLGLRKGVTARAQMYGDILRHSVPKRGSGSRKNRS